jgi:tRNA U34 5-carboxymethylaminomethyl modifying enzyme MnmG/GidA
MNIDYDIIVVGAGHAGCEAALAASRMAPERC